MYEPLFTQSPSCDSAKGLILRVYFNLFLYILTLGPEIAFQELQMKDFRGGKESISTKSLQE